MIPTTPNGFVRRVGASARWTRWEILRLLLLGILALVVFVWILNGMEKSVRRQTLKRHLDKMSQLDLASLLEFEDADQHIKGKALETLSKEKQLSAYAIEKVIRCSTRNDNQLQHQALRCLANHAASVPNPALIAPLLKSNDANVRIGAILVLVNFDAFDHDVFAAFESIFEEKRFLSTAVEETSRNGPRAKKLAAFYFRVCDQGDSWEVCQAIHALRRVGADKERSIAAIAKLLEHQDVWVRSCALQSLGGFEADAAWTLPLLRRRADEDQDCRVFALQAINQIEAARRK